jgi:hypothetical protein
VVGDGHLQGKFAALKDAIGGRDTSAYVRLPVSDECSTPVGAEE